MEQMWDKWVLIPHIMLRKTKMNGAKITVEESKDNFFKIDKN